MFKPESIQENNKYWSLSPQEVIELLETDIKTGLSEAEADDRTSLFGKNMMYASKRTGGLKIFLNQLRSPLILVLIFAGIVTMVISHHRDALFIFTAVIVNALLGFYQENKAERALAELKTYLKQRARVIRDGKEREMDADLLVPGDIIRLAQGDRVPADSRIVFLNDFQVDEAVLTGESLPVGKALESVLDNVSLGDQSSMIFAGTLITQGVATAIVCRTGGSTELGKIAALISESQSEKTPLQSAITNFSIYSSIILGFLTLIVFIIGVLSGYSVLEMFLTSVAIAVSAIPEGLPVSMTVILAVGVERMAKRKGVVRKLVAAEALGSTTIILTDKTGTLTEAKMVLSKLIPFHLSEDQLLSLALTNTDVLIENPDEEVSSWRMNGRIMEMAIVRASALRGVATDKIRDRSKIIQSMPFNAVQKFSGSLIKENETHLAVFLGAPDILLSHANFSNEKREEIKKQIHELASSGERVLGVMTNKVSMTNDFSLTQNPPLSGGEFAGLITFHDPIRPGVKHAIKSIQNAGIRTVIMTGDHNGTAVAIAREIGLHVNENAVLDAEELADLSDGELKKRLPFLSVVSRITPFDKLRIAKLFQEQGEVVAMTGDGVNDAPSIKQANIGIAMGSGTEVSQSVADLVLLDNNFETIVAAIEEGRQILRNIRKVLVYLFSSVTDGLILIGGSLIFGMTLPLSALQILWVNFFTGSFPAIAFAFEKDPDGLSQKIHDPRKGLFSPLMKVLILIIGFSTSLLLFILYIVLTKLGFDEMLVRTFIFAAFGTYTLSVALSVRSLERSIFTYPVFSNKYLNGGILIGVTLMALAIYEPRLQMLFGTVSLPWQWIVAVGLVGVLNIVLIELGKKLFRNRESR